MILAGDVGGTHTRLTLFAVDDSATALVEQTFPSRNFATFGVVLQAFLKSQSNPKLVGACVGIAGPVVDGRCAVSNLPWVVTEGEIAAACGLPHASLINDLEAVGYGIAALRDADVASLLSGAPAAKGNIAVLAMGTGLGVAGLFWDGARHSPFASEGGHASFAPTDDEEIRLLEFLRPRFGEVSCERVLSGPGLLNLYEFLRASGVAEEPWLAAALPQGDAAALISQHAADGSSELCVRTLHLFARLVGAKAGDLALTMMATGGLYLAGGIAPKNLAALRAPELGEAFLNKGRMRPLLERIPVRVVLNEKVGLLGAYRCALHRHRS